MAIMLGYHYDEVDVCLLGFYFLVQVSLYSPIQFCVLFTLLHMSRISFCAKVNAFLYECIIYLAMSLFVILYFQIMVVCCNECPCQVLLLILEDSFKNIYLKELQRKGKTKKKKKSSSICWFTGQMATKEDSGHALSHFLLFS